MSDNTDTTQDIDDNSLWTNLTNKIKYKVHKAAYDPNANKFAQKEAEKEKEKKEEKKEEKAKTTDTDNGDPNKFSIKRVVKRIGTQTSSIIQKCIIPFIALMLAMIVTNDMIIYSVPIRIIFFIFTLLICIFVPPMLGLLSIFYILKGGYSYYVNHMTDRPKQEIMPTIYALLPITTYKPSSSLGSFIMYPFTYPKTELGAEQLPKTMKHYWQDLLESFKDLDKVKNLPIFAKGLHQIQKDLSELHEPKGYMMQFSNSTTKSN